MYRKIVILVLLLGAVMGAKGQGLTPVEGKPNYQLAVVIGGDTLLRYYLKEVLIERNVTLTEKEIRQNARLIRNIKKMLPYAKAARKELEIIERETAGMKKSERKKYMKVKEDEIMAKYAAELKKCSVSQGKVLLKLLDRETGKSAYICASELKGKAMAGFYQSFAWVFGFRPKERYDPVHNKHDNLMERITLYVENGKL